MSITDGRKHGNGGEAALVVGGFGPRGRLAALGHGRRLDLVEPARGAAQTVRLHELGVNCLVVDVLIARPGKLG